MTTGKTQSTGRHVSSGLELSPITNTEKATGPVLAPGLINIAPLVERFGDDDFDNGTSREAQFQMLPKRRGRQEVNTDDILTGLRTRKARKKDEDFVETPTFTVKRATGAGSKINTKAKVQTPGKRIMPGRK